MSRIPESEIQRVKDANDIVDVVSQYVTLDKSSGSNLFGLCPFHGEKTASFSVSRTKQIYYCFGCHNGGDVIRFIMEIEKLSYVDAIHFLAKRAGIDIRMEDTYVDPKKKAKERYRSILKEAAKIFLLNLSNKKGKAAASYLIGRGISVNTAYKFGLGYASSDIISELKRLGYSDDELANCGLFKRGNRGLFCLFNKRLTFPIFDSFGNVIAMGGRKLRDEDFGPKYLNSPETLIYDKGRELYGLNIAKKSRLDYFLIVEGYMDVISLHQSEIDNAIAVLGTALTKEQAKLIRKYKEKVVLCFDSDSAGRQASLRSIDILKDAGIEVSLIQVPSAKDPDEFIREFGKERFLALVDSSMNDIEFKLNLARKDAENSRRPKLYFADAAIKILSEIEDNVRRTYYTRTIAEEILISPSDLQKEVDKQIEASRQKKTTNNKYIKNSIEESVGIKRDIGVQNEIRGFSLSRQDDSLSLLFAILKDHDLSHNDLVLDTINNYLSDDWKELFLKIINRLNKGELSEAFYLPADFRNYRYLSQDLESLISKNLIEGSDSSFDVDMRNIRAICRDIQLDYLTKRRDSIAQEIQKLSNKSSDLNLQKLIDNYNSLVQEINRRRLNKFDEN